MKEAWLLGQLSGVHSDLRNQHGADKGRNTDDVIMSEGGVDEIKTTNKNISAVGKILGRLQGSHSGSGGRDGSAVEGLDIV